MGVIDRQTVVGQSPDEDKLYTFSSKPSSPGEKSPDVLVRFQAVSRTQPCIGYHYCKFNSKTNLSLVRQNINQYFKNYFDTGFIFLTKTKEILRSKERGLTLFDILPKVPNIYNKRKEKEVPNDPFLYPDVQYKKVAYEFEGVQYSIMCACVIFLYEASKVSHWPAEVLHEDLSANTLEGFCFIPTDIMSWRDKIIESRASALHIHAAIGAQKELELTMHQLPGKININHLRDQRGASPLHYAAENGHLDSCELLVSGIGKEIIYQRDLSDKTPLHCALYRRKVKTATYLLQLNSDLTYSDSFGNSCLDLLLKQTSKDLEFIIYKLQIECIDDLLRYQLTWCCIIKGNKPLSRYLVKHLAKFDHDSCSGQSLLHLAVKLKDKDVIDTLVTKGANLRCRDIQDYLPLHIACKYGYTNVQTLFFEEMTNQDLCKGIQLAVRNKNFSVCSSVTSLRQNIAIDEQTFCVVLESLDSGLRKVQQNKCSEKDLNNWENTAKHLLPLVSIEKTMLNAYVFDCAFYGANETLSLLTSLGAVCDISDQMGRTPLHEACQRNHLTVTEALIAAGVNPNKTDWRGSTPLHYACAKDNLQIVVALMAIPRINAGAQDNCGRTPLMVAALHKCHDIVHLFLRKYIQSINVHAVDVYGHSILYYTINMNESCIDLLLPGIESIEKSESRLRRGLKRWNDTGDFRAWSRELIVTEFSFKHVSFDTKENKSVNSKLNTPPFSYQRKDAVWEIREQTDCFNQRKEIKRPVAKCVKCDKYLAHRKKKHTKFAGKHICVRNCLKVKRGDDGRKRMKVKPFSFHSFDFSENITPFIQAARAGQTALMKRLNRFDHTYKDTPDSQHRSILEFAADHNSVGLLKTMFEIKPVVQQGLLHRILMQKARNRKDMNRKSMIEFLLSKGYSPEEIPEPVDTVHDIGTCAWREEDRKPRCSRDCHLKAYTVLEVSVRNNEEDIFKLLLDATNNIQQNFLLNLLAHNGNVWMIESFLRKRTKLKLLKENEAERLDDLEVGHVLDIALCSKKLSTVLIQSLVKVTPDIFVNAYVTDPDEYSIQSRPDMEWNMLYEMTTLGKLMSKDHPLAKLKSKDGKERIENTACFLIDSGIQLDDLMSDFDKRGHVHGVCEAFMCAMENGYFRAAVSVLEEAGDVFWDCAMNFNRCKVQIRFNNTPYPKFLKLPDQERIVENVNRFKHTSKDQCPFHVSITEAVHFNRFHNLKRDFLKYHLLLACEESIPETVLRELLRAGREFFDAVEYPVPDIDLDEIHDNRYDEVCTIDDPICRLLLCVCELMSAYSLFKKRYDVLRILKLAPVLYPYIHLIDRNIFFEPINRGRGSLILQRCVILAYRKREDRKLKRVKMAEGTTLLHLVSSGDSVDIVKSILKAETPIDIDCMAENGLRPIDVAAACGSWNVYKLLCDSGALISGQTLVACCATEKFLGIETWSNHIHGFRHSERGMEKSRVKIAKDICEREGVDLLYEHPEHGTAVANAAMNKFWEVMENFNKKRWSMIKASLQNDGNAACMLFRDGPGRLLTKILQTIEKNLSSVCRQALQQILLQSSKRTSVAILNGIVNIISEKHPSHNWHDLLNIKDKFGMGALHYAASQGFYSPVKIWAERMGHCHFKETCKLDIYDSYTRTQSPVFYALANKHWDIALCLILHGSQPSFKRSIPDFYCKGRYTTQYVDCKPEPGCLCDKEFWTNENPEKCLLRIGWKEKRSFPEKVNVSTNALPCISPDLPDQERKPHHAISPKYQRMMKRTVISDSHEEKKKNLKHILALNTIASRNKCGLIHIACAVGDLDLVQNILKVRPNSIRAEDADGVYPYIYALAGGNIEIIEIMKTNLNQRNVEEALRVLIWKCVLRDIENAKHPILNDNYRQESTNSKVFIDKRKFRYISKSLPEFDQDDQGDTSNQDIENNHVSEKLEDIRDNICSSRMFKKWTSSSFSNIDGKASYLYGEQYILETFKFILHETDVTNLNKKLLLSLFILGRPNLIKEILQEWTTEEETLASLEKPVLGKFTILDCIIIFSESYKERTKSMKYYMEQYREIVDFIISKVNVTLHPEVALIAVKKKLWILFEPVANKIFQNKGVELDLYWLQILAASVEDGELSFFRTILDLIGFPKMDEESKRNFYPFVCLACLSGKADIVKYLLRFNVPVSATCDPMLMIDILGNRYQGSWTVLHYAIKSNSFEVLKIILRSCRYDTPFLQSISLSEIFQLAVEQKDTSIFQTLEDYFAEAMTKTLTQRELETLLIYSARKGYTFFCKHFIVNKDLSAFIADSDNMNTLHYASIYNMHDVAESVLNRAPDVVGIKDVHGFTPFDYAYALGRAKLVDSFSSKTDLNLRPNELVFENFGWLRYHLELNDERNMENEDGERLPLTVTRDKGLCLEGLLLRSDDNAAACYIDCSRYIIAKSLDDDFNSHGKLFHITARFTCLKSIRRLFEILTEEMTPTVLSMIHENLTPMAWAVKMAHLQVIEVIAERDQDKVSLTWKAPITEENILHIAVKTGRRDVVEFIDNWTDGLLRNVEDRAGLTPKTVAVAHGFHHLLAILCDREVTNNYHFSNHNGNKTDYTCMECLLDHGIGWSKIIQTNMFRNDTESSVDIYRPITTLNSTRGVENVTYFQRDKDLTLLIGDESKKQDRLSQKTTYIRKIKRVHKIISILGWCKFRLEHVFVSALMQSMGYNSNERSVLKLLYVIYQKQRKCPPLKMLRLDLQTHPTLEGRRIDSDMAVSLFEVAASIGDKKFFENNTDKFNSLSTSINEKFSNIREKLSLSEIAYGFGHLELGKFLEDELTRFGLHDIFRSFYEMRKILPQKVIWALKLELPGDDSWQIEKEFLQESCRLTKADVWLTTSYPPNVLHDIEQDVVPESIMPPKCAKKKYNPDVDGFAKQSCFSERSAIWMKCLMASTLVYGHTLDIIRTDESRFSTVTSLRLLCLPAESGDHAKTIIEPNGNYVESIALHALPDSSVTLLKDITNLHRSAEAKLRDNIQHKVIPHMQEKILDIFGVDVSIKIDWRSVDSQKRTSGSDTILKLLSDEAGNSLAGLEDVLQHCAEMKDDIINMFNQQTAKFVSHPLSSIREIVIKYVDTLPNLDTVFQRKFTVTQKTSFWHFSIERSTLKYDRSTFKFWHYMSLHHGTCISVLNAVRRIAFCNSNANLKDIASKPITLEIDWKSFGLTDPYTLHKLITQQVAREVLVIAQHCEAMFNLQLYGERVIIQNTTSAKYTGVTPLVNLLTVNVYAHQLKNKKWYVSSENTFTKLCELEDKELGPACNMWTEITKQLQKLQEIILHRTGIPLRIFIDEKRFLSLVFNKCRRDMAHPKTIITKSIGQLFERLPEMYNNVFSFILRSPAATFCKVVGTFEMPTGIWLNEKLPKRRRKQDQFLVICNRNEDAKRDHHRAQNQILRFQVMTREEVDKTSESLLFGPFILKQLHACFADNFRATDPQKMKYISFENTLYQILDAGAMIDIFSSIQAKFVLHDIFFDHMEGITELRLTDKFFTNPIHSLTESSPRPLLITLSQYIKQQPKWFRYLPVGIAHQVLVDWKSFHTNTKDSHEAERSLINAVYSFLDTYHRFADHFHLIENHGSLCHLQERNRTLLCDILNGVTFLIKMQLSRRDSIGGVNNTSQRPNPELYLLDDLRVQLSYRRGNEVLCFAENFQSTVIRILELKMSSEFRGPAEIPEEDSSRRHSSQVSHFALPVILKSRPPLDLVLQIHFQLLEAVREICRIHCNSSVKNLGYIDDVCYLNAHTSKTTIRYVDDILKIQVSPRGFSKSLLIRELYKIPEIHAQIDELSNGKILFRMCDQSVFFSDRTINTIRLKATDSLGNPPEKCLLKMHADKTAFKIYLWKDEVTQILTGKVHQTHRLAIISKKEVEFLDSTPKQQTIDETSEEHARSDTIEGEVTTEETVEEGDIFVDLSVSKDIKTECLAANLEEGQKEKLRPNENNSEEEQTAVIQDLENFKTEDEIKLAGSGSDVKSSEQNIFPITKFVNNYMTTSQSAEDQTDEDTKLEGKVILDNILEQVEKEVMVREILDNILEHIETEVIVREIINLILEQIESVKTEAVYIKSEIIASENIDIDIAQAKSEEALEETIDVKQQEPESIDKDILETITEHSQPDEAAKEILNTIIEHIETEGEMKKILEEIIERIEKDKNMEDITEGTKNEIYVLELEEQEHKSTEDPEKEKDAFGELEIADVNSSKNRDEEDNISDELNDIIDESDSIHSDDSEAATPRLEQPAKLATIPGEEAETEKTIRDSDMPGILNTTLMSEHTLRKVEVIPDKVRIVNDQIEIKWIAADCDLNGKTCIELLHHDRKIDIPKSVNFFGDGEVTKYASYFGIIHGIRIEKDGHINLFIEHDMCTQMKINPGEMDSLAEVCKQKYMPYVSPVFKSNEYRNIEVQFHIFTSPKRYGKGKILPIKISPSSVLSENDGWKWYFQIRSKDSNRQSRIRASCRLCKRYLNIVTPLCSIDPGKELVINSICE